MDDFSTRLQELLDYLNLKPVTLAEEMGVQRTSFNHLLSGRNKPGFEFLYKLHSCYPFINLNWLVSGTGTITENIDHKISPDENNIPKTQSGTDLFSNIFMSPANLSESPVTQPDPIKSIHHQPEKGTMDSHSNINIDEEIDRLIIIYKSGKMVEVKK